MDIYLDFEATQFTENIIAIGASCEYGEFDCLVKPPHKKELTKFITNLTGITLEMIEYALTPDEAFYDLFFWISEMAQEAIGEPIFYHTYGGMDKIFLQNAAKNIVQNAVIKDFVEKLSHSIIDDSYKVCRFFHAKTIGVHKALSYFEEDLDSQDHDPLNDAIILNKLMDYLFLIKPLDSNPFELPKPNNTNQTPSMLGKYSARQINVKNAPIIPFDCFDDAVNWIYKKIKKNNPDSIRKNVKKHLKNAILNNRQYHGYFWKSIKEG